MISSTALFLIGGAVVFFGAGAVAACLVIYWIVHERDEAASIYGKKDRK